MACRRSAELVGDENWRREQNVNGVLKSLLKTKGSHIYRWGVEVGVTRLLKTVGAKSRADFWGKENCWALDHSKSHAGPGKSSFSHIVTSLPAAPALGCGRFAGDAGAAWGCLCLQSQSCRQTAPWAPWEVGQGRPWAPWEMGQGRPWASLVGWVIPGCLRRWDRGILGRLWWDGSSLGVSGDGTRASLHVSGAVDALWTSLFLHFWSLYHPERSLPKISCFLSFFYFPLDTPCFPRKAVRTHTSVKGGGMVLSLKEVLRPVPNALEKNKKRAYW